MQADGRSFERKAKREIPRLLAELLDEPDLRVVDAETDRDHGWDLVATDSRGRRWVAEVKASSGPAQIDRVAAQLKRAQDRQSVSLLVVPYMSKAGAETAERLALNWVDLSGNAHIRAKDLYVRVEGRPNKYRSPGRPSSPFAPTSARVARALLLDPSRPWRQKELSEATGLDDGSVSRIVRRLSEAFLIERQDAFLHPADPDLLLDAWKQDYRFDRHEAVYGHVSGNGMEVARRLAGRLKEMAVSHFAFTGLPAAWVMDHFAQFRLVSLYVNKDPRDLAEALEVRLGEKGANVQILRPDDRGVFEGVAEHEGLRCVSPAQVYLDLLHLPERASEAAAHLRKEKLNWHGLPAQAPR